MVTTRPSTQIATENSNRRPFYKRVQVRGRKVTTIKKETVTDCPRFRETRQIIKVKRETLPDSLSSLKVDENTNCKTEPQDTIKPKIDIVKNEPFTSPIKCSGHSSASSVSLSCRTLNTQNVKSEKDDQNRKIVSPVELNVIKTEPPIRTQKQVYDLNGQSLASTSSNSASSLNQHSNNSKEALKRFKLNQTFLAKHALIKDQKRKKVSKKMFQKRGAKASKERAVDQKISNKAKTSKIKNKICNKDIQFKLRNESQFKSNFNEKLLKCDQCEYRCNRSGHLKVHKFTHSAVKPLKCDQCEFRCITSDHLKRHKFMHSGEIVKKRVTLL
jgi:hypothetical protein